MVRNCGFRPAARRAAGPVAAAALAVVTAACGSSGSSSSSSSAGPAASATATPSASASTLAPLSGAAATALIARALDNTRAATSVRVNGTDVSTGNGGEQASFGITLVRNTGCAGKVSLSAAQSFQIVSTGGYVWVRPSAAFYQSLHLSKQALALLKDKYIKVKSTDKQFGKIAGFCTFSGLFASVPRPVGTSFTATPASYAGQPVYKVTQAGKPGYAYVSGTGMPLLLQLRSNGGTVTFSDYDAARTITPPPDAESIDGSQLGI